MDFQVGINAKSSSTINLTTSFKLSGFYRLASIGIEDEDYLAKIDSLLAIVSAKQVEYGAIENRLNSTLEEISTQYENLLSSCSTLGDADIAEVSSEYIRKQILQEASVTLLATANQSPALALQLL